MIDAVLELNGEWQAKQTTVGKLIQIPEAMSFFYRPE